MLNLYKFISYILIPIILINLYIRLINNKEDSKRYKERIGKTNFNLKLSKKIIWIHAASVGEFKSSDLIIDDRLIIRNFNNQIFERFLSIFDLLNYFTSDGISLKLDSFESSTTQKIPEILPKIQIKTYINFS